MSSLSEYVRSAPTRLIGRPAVRRATASVLDALEHVRGRRDEGLPTRRMMLSIGPSPYKSVFLDEGAKMTRLLRELGGLCPEDDVLDVGCGVGRMALPLTEFLTGRYEGFDVNPESVAWCRERITTRHPRFRFELVDIHNRHYNPAGELGAGGFRFPYDDESFDFVFHTSVFTHLLPDAGENYARESARVLRPGGRCFATFFLLDGERAGRGEAGGLPMRFRVRNRDYWAARKDDPEAVIAYWEGDAAAMFERAGMTTEAHRGKWAGDAVSDGWQDTIVARRAT